MGEIRLQALRSGLKAPDIRRGNLGEIRFPHTMTMVEVEKEELVVRIRLDEQLLIPVFLIALASALSLGFGTD